MAYADLVTALADSTRRGCPERDGDASDVANPTADEDCAMTSTTETERNLEVVRRICEQWAWLSRDELAELMDPACDWSNTPYEGVHRIGPDAAHEILSRSREQWEVSLTIHHIVADGDVVLTERNEHFEDRDGVKPTWDLPVMGIFELRDGKVTAWRDYWDMGAVRRARGLDAGSADA
jgi:limonene-1,2-epoxide hydrolase